MLNYDSYHPCGTSNRKNLYRVCLEPSAKWSQDAIVLAAADFSSPDLQEPFEIASISALGAGYAVEAQ